MIESIVATHIKERLFQKIETTQHTIHCQAIAIPQTCNPGTLQLSAVSGICRNIATSRTGTTRACVSLLSTNRKPLDT